MDRQDGGDQADQQGEGAGVQGEDGGAEGGASETERGAHGSAEGDGEEAGEGRTDGEEGMCIVPVIFSLSIANDSPLLTVAGTDQSCNLLTRDFLSTDGGPEGEHRERDSLLTRGIPEDRLPHQALHNRDGAVDLLSNESGVFCPVYDVGWGRDPLVPNNPIY